MAAPIQQVPVYSQEQLEQTVSSYIAQGFMVMNRAPQSATMFKKKEFSILWLVVGLVLCVFPLIIYLIIYAGQSDQVVEIRLVNQDPAGHLSPDGRWRWDGSAWQPTAPQSISAAPPAPPPAMSAEPSPLPPAMPVEPPSLPPASPGAEPPGNAGG